MYDGYNPHQTSNLGNKAIFPAKDGELSINEKAIGGVNSLTNDMGQTYESNYMLATSRMVVSDVDRM